MSTLKELSIREAYPKIPLSRRFRGVIQLTRPFTLVLPFIAAITTSIMYLAYDDKLNLIFNYWHQIVYGAVTLVLCNIGSNCYNSAYDYQSDKISKPYRPIPQGVISPDEARTLGLFFYLFAVLRASTMNWAFGLFVTLILIVTVAYSCDAIRLKKYLFINVLSIAFARGLLGVIAAWSILGSPTSRLPWVVGIIFFVYLAGAQSSKDFSDAEADKKYGVRTLPNTYGAKSVYIMMALMYSALGLFFVALALGYIKVSIVSYILIGVLIIWSIYLSYLMLKMPNQPNEILENSKVWTHMYLILFTAQIGFCLIYIL